MVFQVDLQGLGHAGPIVLYPSGDEGFSDFEGEGYVGPPVDWEDLQDKWKKEHGDEEDDHPSKGHVGGHPG